MSDRRPNLKDLSVEALRERFREEGLPPWRADQIAGWIYGRGVEDWDAMSDLPADLRGRLAETYRLRALEVQAVERSADGTIKARLETSDAQVVEAVLIPEERRTTLCVSTQVGCPLACSFCATGAMGFRRNLGTAEIVDQVLRMRELLAGTGDGESLAGTDDDPSQSEERRITNVVFMGMGEPLLNLPHVLETIRLLVHPKAFALAPRRVTVSTAGVLPKIAPLVEAAPVNLAVSLHATTDAVRDVLVPLNRRFPLDALMDTLRRVPGLGPRRPIFFEYTLIDGVNAAPEDARRLARLLHGLPAKVNAIPMNPHPYAPYRPPPPEVAERFLAELASRDVRVTLRRPRGADIAAACGQLAAGAPVKAAAGEPVKPASRMAEDTGGGF